MIIDDSMKYKKKPNQSEPGTEHRLKTPPAGKFEDLVYVESADFMYAGPDQRATINHES